MILNYQHLSDEAAINIFPITDSNRFMQSTNWKDRRAYYFTGLEYPMLVCPFSRTHDEALIERPGVYLKTNLPLGGVVYFSRLPDHYNRNDSLENLSWIVDSYLFKFNATRPPHYTQLAPRLYVDYANNRPNHGSNIFDNARVIANDDIKRQIDQLYEEYSHQIHIMITSNSNQINVCNYQETSLTEEVCTHREWMDESKAYLQALINNKPDQLNHSRLTNGFEPIICSKKYNRSVLSFYLAAIKETVPNSPGAYIGMFKNFYNILEYLMQGEGKSHLQDVLKQHIGSDRLRDIIADIKAKAPLQSLISNYLINGEQLSDNCSLPPLSETDDDIIERVGHRLYLKRNAALHSKRTFRAAPVEHNIRPGNQECFQLETDLALIRPIAEIIVEEISSDE